MGTIVWKLAETLRRYDLRPRDVETEAIRLGYGIGRNTIYRVLKAGGPANVNRATLAALLAGLRSLTGEAIAVADILEYLDAA